MSAAAALRENTLAVTGRAVAFVLLLFSPVTTISSLTLSAPQGDPGSQPEKAAAQQVDFFSLLLALFPAGQTENLAQPFPQEQGEQEQTLTKTTEEERSAGTLAPEQSTLLSLMLPLLLTGATGTANVVPTRQEGTTPGAPLDAFSSPPVGISSVQDVVAAAATAQTAVPAAATAPDVVSAAATTPDVVSAATNTEGMSLFSGVNKDEQAQAGAPEPGLTLFPSAGPAEKEPIAEQPVPTSLSLPAQGPEHAKESSVLTPAPPLSPLRDETNPSATTATPIPLSSLGLSTNPQAGLPEQKEQSEKNTKGSAVVLDGSVKESASLPIDRLAAIGGKTPEHSSLVMNQEGTATEKRETLNFLSHSLVSGERQAPGVVNGAQNATLTPQTTTHQTSGQQTWRAVIDQAAGGISLSFHQGNREVQVQLEPPDLGKLNIRLLLDGDHVQARIIAESADVRALIQAHLPELRDALQTQRLDLDVVRVDVQSDTGERNDLAQGFQQDSRPSGQERGTPLPQWTKAESDEPVRGPSVTQRSGVSVWV